MGGIVGSAIVHNSVAPVTAAGESPSEGLGYGAGEYGVGGYGGVIFEDEYDVVLTVSGPVDPALNQPEAYAVRLENHGGATPEPVVVSIAVTRAEGVAEGDITLQYSDGDDAWYELPLTLEDGVLTGSFGPAAGFSLPGGYDETTDLLATFTVPDSYTATVDVVGRGDEEQQYASATKEITVDDPSPTGVCVDLIAGQHTVVGDVCVHHDDTELTVVYTTNGGWALTETHLAVGQDLGEYVANGWVNRPGNPRPGRFPYSMSHGRSTEVTYSVPFDDIDGGPGDVLVIAAHGGVHRDGSGSESVWADGERFRQRGNWAMYFEYTLE